MNKTIVVRVTRTQLHPKYKRIVTQYNKFKTHDEKNEAKIGDTVKIMETRPISKDKRFRLLEIVKKATL
jgi:small subunit ribosomal protein S17